MQYYKIDECSHLNKKSFLFQYGIVAAQGK